MRQELHVRASEAFTPEFRELLRKSVDEMRAAGETVLPHPIRRKTGLKPCYCPEGCLEAVREFRNPWPWAVDEAYQDHGELKHFSFQHAFDYGEDDDTAEAALGLIYREEAIALLQAPQT